MPVRLQLQGMTLSGSCEGKNAFGTPGRCYPGQLVQAKPEGAVSILKGVVEFDCCRVTLRTLAVLHENTWPGRKNNDILFIPAAIEQAIICSRDLVPTVAKVGDNVGNATVEKECPSCLSPFVVLALHGIDGKFSESFDISPWQGVAPSPVLTPDDLSRYFPVTPGPKPAEFFEQRALATPGPAGNDEGPCSRPHSTVTPQRQPPREGTAGTSSALPSKGGCMKRTHFAIGI